MSEVFTNYENNYRNFNQIHYFESQGEEYNKKILVEIKNDLEKLDKEIRNSAMRKQKGYVIKVYVSRKIITIFGEVRIIRTKYQYYNKEEAKNKTVDLFG